MPLYSAPSAVTSLKPSTACTSSSVVAVTTPTLILAANPNRLMTSLVNNSDKILYLDFDGVVSPTDYAVAVPRDTLYEFPINFTGAIHGVWSGVDGTKGALVREFT